MCQNFSITVMHDIQQALSLICLIMHFATEKWSYEYRHDPLLSLTFVGCTIALLAIVARIVDSMRFTETWDQDSINLHYLTRIEIIFEFIAFVMYSSCGVVIVIYDYRPKSVIKGALSMINGICFLLDVLVCHPCLSRWGRELDADDVQRLNERRAFYHLATNYYAHVNR